MNTPAAVPLKNAEEAKKPQPKFIEKVIEKVEEALTKPVSQSKGEITNKPQLHVSQQPPAPSPTPEQVQVASGGNSEYILPEGTTIKLPDGNEFETHAESKISKVKGGEV